MPKVYNQIFEALDDKENGTKEMIRNYLSEMSMYNKIEIVKTIYPAAYLLLSVEWRKIIIV